MGTIEAKFPGTCRRCSAAYSIGDSLIKAGEGWIHAAHGVDQTSGVPRTTFPNSESRASGDRIADYEGEGQCEICHWLWDEGQRLVFLTTAVAARYLGQPPPFGDVWVHRSCLYREGDSGSLHPGLCSVCGSTFPAGTSMTRLIGRWVERSCADDVRREIREIRVRLDQPATTEDRIDLILEGAALLWPGCDAIESDVRVSRTGPDSWFIHVRPLLHANCGTVDSSTFEREDLDLYTDACRVLADYVGENWDSNTGRYPDEIYYPEFVT